MNNKLKKYIEGVKSIFHKLNNVDIVLLSLCVMLAFFIVYNNSQVTEVSSSEEIQTTEVTDYPVAGINSEILSTMDSSFCKTKELEKQNLEAAVETATETDITEEDEFPEMDMFTTSTVNVRKGSSTNHDVIAKFQPNTVVTVINQQDNWSQIEHDGEVGWICTDYLKEYDPSKYIELGDVGYAQQELVQLCIEEFGLDVDQYFIYGLMYVESRFNRKSTSNAEAMGVMQVIPSTWRTIYRQAQKEHPEFTNKYVVDDGYDTNSNIVIGMFTLKSMMNEIGVDSLKDNASRLLTSYNRGCGGANRYYAKHGTYSTGYSKDVLRAAEFIRQNKYWKEGI